MPKINFKVPTQALARSPVEIARSYIAAGVPVFPCREVSTEGVDHSTGEIVTFAEKAPYTPDGLKGATKSGRIVTIWFGERQPGAVIGLPTGAPLGAWVLDLDRHANEDGSIRDGHLWLAQMEERHGPLPATARARTANGGTHIFFKHIDGIRNRAAIADGVDTRGQGGYIVGPGSVMADGRRYEWIDHNEEGMPAFADAPQWLVDMVKTKPIPVGTTTYSGGSVGSGTNVKYVDRAVDDELANLASTPQGGRNAALNDAAFKLGRLVGGGHLSEADARSSLESIAQQWPNFHKSKGTITRGLKDGMAQPRDVTAPSYANDNVSVEAVDKMLEERRLKRELAATVAASVDHDHDNAISERVDMDAPPKPKVRERFDLTWFDQIEEGKPKEEFIKKVLGEREFTTVSGLPGTGKSVIVTDMACHVAKGMDWHGKKVRQGLVIYVAAERKKLTERRMMAFRKKHDVHDVPLLVIGGRLDFTKDLVDAKALISVIKEAETATGERCVWVIIDTLTRVFGAGDQNASKDMSRFVQACDEILAETSAHVTAIHHSAWSGERGKGAIDLDGAVDASFMVKKENGKYKLICDGTNDGEEGEILCFTMDSVEIGRDEEGEPTTAPVVVVADGSGPGEKLSKTAKKNKVRAFELLQELIEAEGVPPQGGYHPEGVLVIHEETWRQACYADDKGAKQDTLRARFKRAVEDLVESKEVTKVGEWVRIS